MRKELTMKKILTLLIIALMAFTLCSCKADTEGTTEGDQEQVTLSVWYYADAGTGEVYETWANDINEKYPWITIELEELPYDSGPQKFTVACATDTTPDIYIDGYSRIAPAVNSGLTMDLTDVYDANKDIFVGTPIDGAVDGKFKYLATHTGLAYGMMYNKDLADELGVSEMIPNGLEPWSYEDFLNVCRAAKKANPDIIPVALYAGSQSSDAWYYSSYIANGAELLNEDHTKVVFNEGENKARISETLNFYKTLIDEGLTPNGVATMTDEDCDTFFCAGKLLFEASGTFGSISYFNGLMEEGSCVPFTWECAVMPTSSGEATPDSGSWGTYGFCAFDHGDAKAEAVKIVLNEYLQNPTYHSQICTLVGKESTLNTTKVEYPSEHISDCMKKGAEYTISHGRSDFGILESWWTDFRMTHYPQMQDFYTGKIDAGTMLDNWAAEATKVIPQ